MPLTKKINELQKIQEFLNQCKGPNYNEASEIHLWFKRAGTLSILSFKDGLQVKFEVKNEIVEAVIVDEYNYFEEEIIKPKTNSREFIQDLKHFTPNLAKEFGWEVKEDEIFKNWLNNHTKEIEKFHELLVVDLYTQQIIKFIDSENLSYEDWSSQLSELMDSLTNFDKENVVVFFTSEVDLY